VPTLTALQVAAAAYIAGFRGNQLAEAVAVARGESSFNTDLCTGQYCGLWQIGTVVNKDKIKGDVKNPVVNAKAAKKLVDDRGWCGGKAANGHCQNFEAYQLDNAGMTWAQKMEEGKKAKKDLDHEWEKDRLTNTFKLRSQGDVALDILHKAGISTKGLAPNTTTEGLTTLDDELGDLNPLDNISAAFSGVNDFFSALKDKDTWIRVAEVTLGAALVIVALVNLTNLQKYASKAVNVVGKVK
jgi:Lysozyme like domain